MKIVIVDTNIIFSCLLNPNGKVGDLLINSRDCIEYYAPSYLRLEVEKHKERIRNISKLSDLELEEVRSIIFSRISFINDEQIPFQIWRESARTIREIDTNDVAFLAISKYLDEDLWTSDKRLYKGLKSKGYPKVISTDELLNIRENLRKE